jgi:hypothetical protein
MRNIIKVLNDVKIINASRKNTIHASTNRLPEIKHIPTFFM